MNNMFCFNYCPPNTPFYSKKGSFERPARLRIRKENGDIEVIGVGMLDTIEYWAQECDQMRWTVIKEEVKMTDGSSIIGYTEDFHVEVPWSLKESFSSIM